MHSPVVVLINVVVVALGAGVLGYEIRGQVQPAPCPAETSSMVGGMGDAAGRRGSGGGVR